MFRKICALLLLCLAPLLSGCLKEKSEKAEEEKNVQVQQPDKVLDYLALSAHFLINQQKPDGFFKYEYDFITGNYTHWDNVVHQTRAGYALMQYYIFLIRNNIDARLASAVLSSAQKALQGYAAASVSHNSMPGKLISFYYNNTGSPASSPKNQESITRRLEAEISATAFALITETSYWSFTSDTAFSNERAEWKEALIYHAKQALRMPVGNNPSLSHVWLAFSIYDQIIPADQEIEELLVRLDAHFTNSPRFMKNVEDYTWDMIAADIRFQKTQKQPFTAFAARQTTKLLEDMYARHDTSVNSCALSLGLVEASLILTEQSGDYARIEQTALGRSQLEYYSSLKYTILPNQAWIALGPGRTLHSQDFKKFAGASVFGMHTPSTNIGLIEMCLLTGMRFSNEDLKELKQKTGRE